MSELCLKDRGLLVSLIKISAHKFTFQVTVTILVFCDFSSYLMGNMYFKSG